MVPGEPVKQLTQLRNDLLKHQEFLIEQLKTKCPKADEFLVESKIDIYDLSKYSANISTALVIAIASGAVSDEAIDKISVKDDILASSTDVSHLSTISGLNPTDLQGLTLEQKIEKIRSHYEPVISHISKKI